LGESTSKKEVLKEKIKNKNFKINVIRLEDEPENREKNGENGYM
jgi:hypothetical protein